MKTTLIPFCRTARRWLLAAALAAASPAFGQSADDACSFESARLENPGEVTKSHAVTIHGEPLYPAGFTQLDTVNVDAPKGGTVRQAAVGTFDSFNDQIPKGNASANPAVEGLTVTLLDDPGAQYGLLAESIEVPADRSWVAFHLRPEARWHDGEPVTAQDVAWTYRTLMEHGGPQFQYYYGDVTKAEVLSPRHVKFHFKEANNNELPAIVAQMDVLPKHYWADKDFTATTLTPPLGSGPYRIKDYEAGREVTWERVEDYWGKDLAINRGRNNFDSMRYIYFRDRTIARQALKAGKLDFWMENTSKSWAGEYDIKAVNKGWLVKEAVQHGRPAGMQAFTFNLRRPKFQDERVRKAIALAFDFEWSNDKLFYGLYARSDNFFENSDLASTGLPEGDELALLECFRGRIPDSVFTEAYGAPSTDGSGYPRDNLRQAFTLLADAGYEIRDFKQVNKATGEPLRFEVLMVSPAFERIFLPYARNLEKLGIDVGVRLVDSSQYINRLRSFDFDMITAVWGQSNSPGNEQRFFWSSEAADSPSSRNYAGLKDEAVDELVELLIQAPTREALIIRTRALDRVLLHLHFIVPGWHAKEDKILYWDKFSRPEKTPLYGTGLDRWWYDEAKAEALRQARQGGS